MGNCLDPGLHGLRLVGRFIRNGRGDPAPTGWRRESEIAPRSVGFRGAQPNSRTTVNAGGQCPPYMGRDSEIAPAEEGA